MWCILSVTLAGQDLSSGGPHCLVSAQSPGALSVSVRCPLLSSEHSQYKDTAVTLNMPAKDQGFTEDQIEDFKEVFQLFDTKGDGLIQVDKDILLLYSAIDHILACCNSLENPTRSGQLTPSD